MTKKELDFLEAERTELQAILSEIPSDAVIDRATYLARMKVVENQIKTAAKKRKSL